MKKEITITIQIKTKKEKALLGFGVILVLLFFVWFYRGPISSTDIKLNEVKHSGNRLIIDGTFKDKWTRYKGYSIQYVSTGNSNYAILKINGGIIGKRDIHIETNAMKNNRPLYLYYKQLEVRAEDVIRQNK
ncbi:hypothetical protein SAMN05216378_4519 [Paenibacillus catalpae]|uniref:Uncharacterized protein n=1 Tax=Paenibacillus catalpae TaxID=1045775 RepID=A0A1I2EVB5_9BACL|nr:hypothetical protein [Paenibacillus catalpae]SFE96416.1 hypothetical protein SAMN05216378_4519 [Paenibacillus catalpae]